MKTYYVERDKLPSEKDREFQGDVVKISGVFMNNGEYVDLKDKNAEIIYDSGAKKVSYDINESNKGLIAMADILSFKIEVVKGNVLTPIVIVIGAAVVAFMILGIALLTGHGHFY